MSNRKFIETELKENPEFFKAFPHLQQVFQDPSEKVSSTSEDQSQQQQPQYEENKTVNFSDLKDQPDYFGGLLYQRNKFRPNEGSVEEIIRSNEKNFVEGSTSVEGPFKYMSADRIDQIHEEIDI